MAGVETVAIETEKWTGFGWAKMSNSPEGDRRGHVLLGVWQAVCRENLGKQRDQIFDDMRMVVLISAHEASGGYAAQRWRAP